MFKIISRNPKPSVFIAFPWKSIAIISEHLLIGRCELHKCRGGVLIIIHELTLDCGSEFFKSEVVKDIGRFKSENDVILENRFDSDILAMLKKYVFRRNLFSLDWKFYSIVLRTKLNTSYFFYYYLSLISCYLLLILFFKCSLILFICY